MSLYRRCAFLFLTFVISVVGIVTDPGSRYGSALWVDNNDVIWLFGGQGYGETSTTGALNDLWYYTNSTWYWVPTNSTSINQFGYYFSFNLAHATVWPGGRRSMAYWTDLTGNLWLFGGIGYGEELSNYGALADLWTFNVTSWQWTFVTGSTLANSPAYYGNPNEYSNLFYPSSRYSPSFTTDAQGNFVLFGGSNGPVCATENCTNIFGYLNDLWIFLPDQRKWGWISGSPSETRQPGYYGDLNVPSPLNIPSGRENAASWFQDGCFYMFGGNAISNTTIYSATLGDMWRYNMSTNQWTWISGTPNYPPQAVFGTKGQASSNSVPGGRDQSQYWLGDDGLLYMFSGKGFVAGTDLYFVSDLWSYDISTGQWTWVDGSDQIATPSVFTSPGSPGNVLGSSQSAAFAYKNGITHVYGGRSLFGLVEGLSSLLWSRDVNGWNWVAGSNQQDQLTFYPGRGTPTTVAAPLSQGPAYPPTTKTPTATSTPSKIQPPSVNSTAPQAQTKTDPPANPPAVPPVVPPVNLTEIVVPSTIIPVCAGVGLFVLIFLLQKKKRKDEEKMLENEIEQKGILDMEMGKYEAVPVKNDDVPTNMQMIPRNAIELVKEIGAGSFGKVFKAKYRGSQVAVKVSNAQTSAADFIKEANFQMNIPPHPNIVQFFGICVDELNVLVVLEFCGGGSLDKVLFEGTDLISEAEKISMAKQIARGLYHLHENNIVHRDLAARNVLIHGSGSLKISDFGMSRKLDEDVGKTASTVGPIRWMAPESIRSLEYSKKSDIWTFGIVLYEIVTRQEPHHNMPVLDVGIKIRDDGLVPNIPETCPKLLADVMQMCWKVDPKDRADIDQICEMLEKDT